MPSEKFSSNINIILLIIFLILIIFLYINYNSNKNNSNTETFKINTPDAQMKVYYTNWCGHSRNLLNQINTPEFQSVYNTVSNKCPLVLVDCEKDAQMCASNSINGYPTILLFNKDQVLPYDGERTASAMVNFVNSKLNPVSNPTPITPPVQNVKNTPQLKVFYTNWCGHSRTMLAKLDSDEFKQAFKQIQDRCKLVLVDCEKDEAQCNINNIRGYPTIILFVGDKAIPYEGPRDSNSIIKFIQNNM
jgi:thioredoxin-like negative regulator of GroEL